MNSYVDTKHWIDAIISMWEENKFFIGDSLGEKLEALEKSVRAQALLTAEELGANVTTIDIKDGDRLAFYHAHRYQDTGICQNSGSIFDRLDSGVEQDIRRLSGDYDFEELSGSDSDALMEEYVNSLLEPIHKWYRENSARFR